MDEKEDRANDNGQGGVKDNQASQADKIKEQQTTYEIYAEMPDDGMRYEIFDGTLEAMAPGAGFTHQTVSAELGYLLQSGCKSDYRIFYAPFDVILNRTNVVQPDIMMIHRSRASLVTERGIEGPPDLVVEILSPSSGNRDRVRKRRIYERFGVAEYWIVDPVGRTLEQLHLVGSEYVGVVLKESDVVRSDKLPCVAVVVADIFKDAI